MSVIIIHRPVTFRVLAIPDSGKQIEPGVETEVTKEELAYIRKCAKAGLWMLTPKKVEVVKRSVPKVTLASDRKEEKKGED